MTRRTSMDPGSATKPVDQGVDGLGLFDGAVAIEQTPIVRRTEVRAHRRQVEGPPLPNGEERKQSALDAHEVDHVKSLAVSHVRTKLAELYRLREMQPVAWPTPFVNADDIARILAAWPHRPKLLDTIEGHWKGAIFRKGFEMMNGSDPSTRDEMNGTRLPRWRVR